MSENKNKLLELKQKIIAKYNFTDIVVDLLFNRGFDTEEKINYFLTPTEKNFYNPFLLSGMKELVDRVNKAIKENEKVLIFGDYDVDGVSATAILYKYFESKNFKVDYFLPNRYIDGYGLTNATLLNIKEKFNPSLIITVDCGIACFNEVEYAKTLGIEIIVTDHHDIPEIIPNTIVVNAKLNNQKYPFDSLCGTGVAFKIVQALGGLEEAKKYLGIAAIATIADIVPLVDENRAIVKFGMQNFSNNLPLGIKLLFKDNKLDYNASSTDIAFKLSPKINAAGRMGDAGVALNLYINNNKQFLENTIVNLNNLNQERQALCNSVYEDVLEKLTHINLANYNCIVLYSKKWDSGILGIVSAKIANEFHRPTILFQEKDGELKGSARSINDIDIFSAISSLKEVLEAFGGHKMAAGLTIKVQNFKNFISSINNYLSQNYSAADFIPTELYDYNLTKEQATIKLAKELEIFEPCGCGNPKPVFNIQLDKSASISPMPKHPAHININNKSLSIVCFNSYKYLSVIKNSVDRNVQVELQISNYKNKSYLKGLAKNISTGILDKPKNQDILLGEYLKQLTYNSKVNKNVQTYNKQKLESIIYNANKELFGTLFIANSYETYCEFLKVADSSKYSHFIHEIVSNSGLNAVVLAPINFNNFALYKNIVLLDPPLSKNYINALSANISVKVFIPQNSKFNSLIFKGISDERNLFAHYFKLLSNFAKCATPFYNDVDMFKKLKEGNKEINFRQFIYCLYSFIELNIFSIISVTPETFTLQENKNVCSKLTNSNFYNQVSLILKTI